MISSPTSALSQNELGEIGHFQRFRGKNIKEIKRRFLKGLRNDAM